MTLGDVALKARALTNTVSNLTDYPDANLLIDINLWYQKAVTMILESQDESDFDDNRRTDYPIQTTPMVANQRDYPFGVSEKVLKIRRVDFSWNGGTNWFRALPFDTGTTEFGIGFDSASPVDAEFDQNFMQTSPRYSMKYNSLWVYPMPVATDVTNGALVRVEWERQIQPFTSSDYTTVITDSTVVPGFDDPFHMLLAYGAAFEYATSRQLPQLKQIQGMLQDTEQRMRQHYSRKDIDRLYSMTPDYSNSYK